MSSLKVCHSFNVFLLTVIVCRRQGQSRAAPLRYPSQPGYPHPRCTSTHASTLRTWPARLGGCASACPFGWWIRYTTEERRVSAIGPHMAGLPQPNHPYRRSSDPIPDGLRRKTRPIASLVGIARLPRLGRAQPFAVHHLPPTRSERVMVVS